MNLESALAELAQNLGIGELQLDDDGGCLLGIDDDHLVEIESATDQPGFFLTATVGPAPRLGREAVFAELLQANLLGQGSGRACLALDGDLDEIVLCRYVDREDIDSETLAQELEAFLALLEAWKARHEVGEIGAARSPAAAPAQLPVANRVGFVRG